MTDEYLAKEYVDHFLQAEIIQKLAESEKPIRFSELKEDGIENSLFMYHANKLIGSGLIAKSKDGFYLTAKGVRWLNYTGTRLFRREVLPKPLVQCIIKANNSVLIAKRTGSMKTHMNKYMLPGGLHKFGKTANDAISLYLQSLFAESVDEPDFVTVAESIAVHKDEFVHHTISHIYCLSLPDRYQPIDSQMFDYDWIDEELIKSSSQMFAQSQIVPKILEKQSQLKHYETFLFQQD